MKAQNSSNFKPTIPQTRRVRSKQVQINLYLFFFIKASFEKSYLLDNIRPHLTPLVLLLRAPFIKYLKEKSYLLDNIRPHSILLVFLFKAPFKNIWRGKVSSKPFIQEYLWIRKILLIQGCLPKLIPSNIIITLIQILPKFTFYSKNIYKFSTFSFHY